MRPRPPARERGFVLLIVLWTLSLLALVTGYLVSAGRQEATVAGNLRGAAMAQAAADGAVFGAALQIFAGRWKPDGTPHTLTLGPSSIDVRIANEAGKINPNASVAAVLQSLMFNLGIDAAQSVRLAAAMQDWRMPGEQRSPMGAKGADYRAAGLPYGPSGEPFKSLDEIGLVLGMTQDILALLRPHLSLYQEGAVDPAYADPQTAQALRDVHGSHLPDVGASPNLIVQITATATGPGRARFIRQAVFRFRARNEADQPFYQTLSWEMVND